MTVPSVTSTLLLRCPKCRKELQVERRPEDYPEAARMELTCEECNSGDFAETCYFDAAGRHITRDPEAAR
jgi:hypothetical protein